MKFIPMLLHCTLKMIKMVNFLCVLLQFKDVFRNKPSLHLKELGEEQINPK